MPLASQYDADIDNMDAESNSSDEGDTGNLKGGLRASSNRSYGDTTTTRSFGHGRYILADDADDESGTPRSGSRLGTTDANNRLRENNQLRDGFNSNGNNTRTPKFEIGSFNETNF